LSLLQDWQLAWLQCGKRLRRRGWHKRSSHNEDAEYLDAISPKD